MIKEFGASSSAGLKTIERGGVGIGKLVGGESFSCAVLPDVSVVNSPHVFSDVSVVSPSLVLRDVSAVRPPFVLSSVSTVRFLYDRAF